MKKLFITSAAAVAVAFALAASVSAQTATFVYNNGTGTPNAGVYSPGGTFSFSINLVFTPGGTVSNLEGLSYWFESTSVNPPFNFSITLRDITGSMFTDLQTPGLTYPQLLGPQSTNDLGALLPGPTGLGAGTYLVANLTFSISSSAAPGVYTIRNTISGGKTSVISSDAGNTAAIPASLYTITIVPEPGTYALLTIAAVGLGGLAYRRRVAAR